MAVLKVILVLLLMSQIMYGDQVEAWPSGEDVPLYDSTAYTECKIEPEPPLYGGGLLNDDLYETNSSSFSLRNLDQGSRYCFSIWIKTNYAEESLIRSYLVTEETNLTCIGTVVAKKGCWSFLKGGFVLPSFSNASTLYIKNKDGTTDGIEIASSSLQPFTEQQWRFNQDLIVNETRRRGVIVHAVDQSGIPLQGVEITVELLARDFPFGSAIASSILGNAPYQEWFLERFNAAVFENELKWYATETTQENVNYTVPDLMLEFLRTSQIAVRGHNIVWTDHVPAWSLNLTRVELQSAVDSRIESLLEKYKGQFIHWDVNNELLHSAFFEDHLGPDATLQIYRKVQQADPLAGLFMNEFSVVESCDDDSSTVDTYISKIKELGRGGVIRNGIGLQGHFTEPNPPLSRAVLDKFATLDIPIWLTEVDMSRVFAVEKQGVQLETVLREGYSHPAVGGIILWAALRGGTCDRMCLTDPYLNNLPTGDTVDRLLLEWDTKVVEGRTDESGAYAFYGCLGEYKLTATCGDTTSTTTFSLARSKDTKHVNIQL